MKIEPMTAADAEILHELLAAYGTFGLCREIAKWWHDPERGSERLSSRLLDVAANKMTAAMERTEGRSAN